MSNRHCGQGGGSEHATQWFWNDTASPYIPIYRYKLAYLYTFVYTRTQIYTHAKKKKKNQYLLKMSVEAIVLNISFKPYKNEG